MLHIGLDVHKENTVWHAVDDGGRERGRGELPTREAELVAFLHSHPKEARLYFEAGTASAWLYRLVVRAGIQAVVVDPNRNKMIASSTKKTDKHDAATLATLGRADLYEPVYVRSEETDAARRVLTARSGLVSARGDLIRVVRAFFRAEGTPLPNSKTADFARLTAESPLLTMALALVVKPMLDAIAVLSTQIEGYDHEIHELAIARPEVTERLLRIPGVGENVAVGFMLYIEDVERFGTAGEVSAALGLVPSVRESAGKRQDGHITRRGKKSLRNNLVQAAWAHVRSKEDTALKRWFEAKVKKGGKGQRKKVITGLARKLAELMWTLWRRGTAYQPFPRQSRRAPSPP